jgi:hypothetical protein
MTDPKPFVSTTASSADEDDVTGLRPPSRVSKLVQSSSVETTSKASTRKEKPSSEAQQADEKKAVSETPEETQSSADEPEAVSTSKETETNPPNRKKLILILVAAVIVIVAVVTGATVGANLRGSNEQAEATDPVSENKPTAAPNPSPTAAPAPSPATAPAPSPMSPSMTTFPSVAPTKTPNNDFDVGNEFCTDVVNPLPTDGSFFGGTVIGIGPNASSTDGIPLCQEEPFSYPFLPSTGLVAWFLVIGTGAPLRFYSCVFSPVFRFPIYSGNCGNLTCVDTLTQGVDFGDAYSGGDDVYGGYSYGGYSYGDYTYGGYAPGSPGSGYGGGRSLQGVGGDGGVDPFCPLFVEWESVVNETYYIRAETNTTSEPINVVEYVFQVEEQ